MVLLASVDDRHNLIRPQFRRRDTSQRSAWPASFLRTWIDDGTGFWATRCPLLTPTVHARNTFVRSLSRPSHAGPVGVSVRLARLLGQRMWSVSPGCFRTHDSGTVWLDARRERGRTSWEGEPTRGQPPSIPSRLRSKAVVYISQFPHPQHPARVT